GRVGEHRRRHDAVPEPHASNLVGLEEGGSHTHSSGTNPVRVPALLHYMEHRTISTDPADLLLLFSTVTFPHHRPFHFSPLYSIIWRISHQLFCLKATLGMKCDGRIGLLLVALASGSTSVAALAADTTPYPTKAMRIVVPYAP